MKLQLLHTSYIGIPTFLTTATEPKEVSGGENVLDFALERPEDAIRNPDSLMYFALGKFSYARRGFVLTGLLQR